MRNMGVIGVVLGLAVLGAVWCTAISEAMPRTVMHADRTEEFRPLVSGMIPQGWSFFTRDPQSAALVLYELDERGGLSPAGSLPQTSWANGGGISRDQRSQDTEKSLLAGSVGRWEDCAGEAPAVCSTRFSDGEAEQVVPLAKVPNFCGRYLLVVQSPRPFAFRNYGQAGAVAERAALLDVLCEVSDE